MAGKKDGVEDAAGFISDGLERAAREAFNEALRDAQKDGVITPDEQEAINEAIETHNSYEAINNATNTPVSSRTSPIDPNNPRHHSPNSRTEGHQPGSARPAVEGGGKIVPGDEPNWLDAQAHDIDAYRSGQGLTYADVVEMYSGVHPANRDSDLSWGGDQRGPSHAAPGRPGAIERGVADPIADRGEARSNTSQPGYTLGSETGYSVRGRYAEEGPGVSLPGPSNSSPNPNQSPDGFGQAVGERGEGGGQDHGGPSSSGPSVSGGGTSNGAPSAPEGLSPGAGSPGSPSSNEAPSPSEGRTGDHGRSHDDPGFTGAQPVILDLDSNGVQITELSRSTHFVDATGDGLLNLTAWAAAGDAVLFIDDDGDGTLSEHREYIFTEWDPTATSDIEALRAVFDSNHDGVLDSNDARFSDFRLQVTLADGSTEVKTLSVEGIASIDLTADATNIALSDGSVITGQTTFERTDGSTGIVADAVLVADTQSNRVMQVETTSNNGTRTETSTGYWRDGVIAFEITSVTNVDGTNIDNSYDDDGDGVMDRLQKIETATDVNGVKTETLTNWAGGLAATAIVLNRTQTITSADGNTITIERDPTGGGWFYQSETRTTHSDDSFTIALADLTPSGATIRTSTDNVSSNGLIRTKVIDANGDSTTDLTVVNAITINVDNSRSETVDELNSNGTLRSKMTESVSADGQTKTTTYDLDGDGDTDLQEDLDIVVNADGSTSSSTLVKNGDGSLRNSVTSHQSDDALTKSSLHDLDGDGTVDLTVNEVTVVNPDSSRETTTTQLNADGSIRSLQKITLGSDSVSSQTWFDHNQDGLLANDLVREVAVDAITQERSTGSWARNADGTFSARSVSVSSLDGLSIATSFDTDGDGDNDLVSSDITVLNADNTSTRTLTTHSQNNTLISSSVVVTSADGLTVTTWNDLDGDGTNDRQDVQVSVLDANGGTTETASVVAGDGSTLLVESVTVQSADRRTSTTTADSNGDGQTDSIVHSQLFADGSTTETETRYHEDGSKYFEQTSTVSGDGLTISSETDLDGDNAVDVKSLQTTALNVDGSRTTTTTTRNGDDSLRSQSEGDVSDDGLVTVIRTDQDGIGSFERIVTSTTVLEMNGDTRVTEDVHAKNGVLLTRTETIVNDDGLIAEVRDDADGDLSADIVSLSTTTLNADGSTTVDVEVTDVTGGGNVLRSRETTTTSDNARSITMLSDVNGDGADDMSMLRIVGDDGSITVTETQFEADGTKLSEFVTETSDNGLIVENSFDADGDSVFERMIADTTVLNSDGSTTQTILEASENGNTYRIAEIDTSKSGWTVTRREDWDNDGDDDLTTVRVYDLDSGGVETVTVTQTSVNGDTLNTDETTTSADKHLIVRNADFDGNTLDDLVSTITIAADGDREQLDAFFDVSGTALSTYSTVVSGDGLTTISTSDRDADGDDELVVTTLTMLNADGSRSTATDYAQEVNGSTVNLASTSFEVNDDGLQSTWSADFDGDDVDEYSTSLSTSFADNGDLIETALTTDAALVTLSGRVTTTSGNGLITTTTTNFDGDAVANRTSNLTVQSNQAWQRTDEQFGAGGTRIHSVTSSQSADGRVLETVFNSDGIGLVDRDQKVEITLDREVVTTSRDLQGTSIEKTVIVGTQSANGVHSNFSFDINADVLGDSVEPEFIRETDISFGNDASRISEFVETHGNRVTFTETMTEAANGLSRVVVTDVDGDGSTDTTTASTTTLFDDGRQQVTTLATYANGETKYSLVRDISADGRTTTETYTYDNEGDAEIVTVTTLGADGRITIVEESHDLEGTLDNTRTTMTTGDGLLTTISTDETNLVMEYSPIGNGSYTVTYSDEEYSFESKHLIDGTGIETWSLDRTIDGVTETFSAKLDVASKQRVIAEGERLYDTVFDRDLDESEYETLVEFVANGELDLVSLADDLIQSEEFTTRYPDITNAAFVDQIYMSALGRGASLNEAAKALSALSIGTQTQSEFAAQVSELSEHHVVGNGHLATNNFDVFLNPAQAEHSIDRAESKYVAERLIDILYDIELPEIALEFFAKRVVDGKETPLGLARELTGEGVSTIPIPDVSLAQLTDAEFVEHVFGSAFQAMPSASVVTIWVGHLNNGDISRGEFALFVAKSVEYLTEGPRPSLIKDYYYATPTSLAAANLTQDVLDGAFGDARDNSFAAIDHTLSVQVSGGDGADTIVGGQLGDLLSGDLGADQITGGGGNDVIYFDAADTLVEGGTGRDTAIFIGSQDLTFDLVPGSFEEAYGGDGNDVLSANYAEVSVGLYGGAGNDSLSAGEADDTLFGDSGNDTLDAGDGNDYAVGGSGNDSLYGGSGDDFLSGGSHNDYLHGGLNDDILNGDDGSDTVWGGYGDDFITGGIGSDTLRGSYGDDRIYGNNGWDLLEGGDGDDSLEGGNGNDAIFDGDGDDFVDGGSGNDTITDGQGDDWLVGGEGDDRFELLSYSGSNVVQGGLGSDVLVLNGFSNMWIWDYVESAGQGVGQYLFRSGDTTIQVQDVETVEFTGSGSEAYWSHFDNMSRTEFSLAYIASHNGLINNIGADWSTGSAHFLNYGQGVSWGMNFNYLLYLAENPGLYNTYGFHEVDVTEHYIRWGRDEGRARTGFDAEQYLRNYGDLRSVFGSDLSGATRHFIEYGRASGRTDSVLAGAMSLADWANWLATSVALGTSIALVEADAAEDNIDTFYWANDLAETDPNQIIYGYAGTADNINGGDGNDTIQADNTGSGYDLSTPHPSAGRNDTIFGGNGADEIYAGLANDLVNGEAGADVIFGEGGNDVLSGGDGADIVRGGSGNDTIEGGSGSDLLEGQGGDDEIDGGDGADVLTGGFGADLLNGQGGSDYIEGGFGNDFLHGKLGADTLLGDYGNDKIWGNAGADFLRGGYGTDTLNGGLGDDTLFGDAQDDLIWSGSGHDWAVGGAGNDTIEGELGLDLLDGGDGDDILRGGEGNDILYGGAGSDLLNGGAENDVLYGGLGADTIKGDTGVDTASYAFAGYGVYFDLDNDNLGSFAGEAAGDEFVSIENAYGSAHSDTIFGTHGHNVIWGADGDDRIYGKGGNDDIFGGAGNDTLFGNYGQDRLDGGTGNDVLNGSIHADRLIGGEGRDRAQYGDALEGLIADLSNASVNTGEAAGDTYESIEDLLGTGFDDDLRGTVGENYIWGGAGNDTLRGLDGDDTIEGQDGNDILFGGAGADVLSGQGGFDRVQYSDATAGVLADLGFAQYNTGIAAGDVYYGIEGLFGTAYNDQLRGNSGNNTLWGDGGNDVLHGRLGNDILSGGAGVDSFHFLPNYDSDTVIDFEDDVDRLVIGGFNFIEAGDALVFASEVNGDVVFDFGNGDVLTVLGSNLIDLADDVFVYA